MLTLSIKLKSPEVCHLWTSPRKTSKFGDVLLVFILKMAYYKLKFKRKFNVNRVVKRLVRTVLALYVGGTIMTVFGQVMNGTCSPFYTGLSLIGWTVATSTCGTATGTANTITATSGSGVLAVVGIIAIAQIVTEFVTW